MRTALISVGALLLSAAILLAGGGLLGTLVAVRAQAEGFALPFIGLLMSSYYLGFIAGCFATPHLVLRAGHIRAFGALAALTAAATLMLAISQNMGLWLVLRVIVGFCFSGLYMIMESWINEKSPNEKRGQILAIFRIVDLVAVTIGQFLLLLSNPAGFILFSIVSILICLSIVPLAMTKALVPQPISHTSLNLQKLYRVSPIAVFSALAVGMTNAAFLGISPAYISLLGYDLVMVSLFISVAIISGALAQWPIGYISDFIDRRLVLLFVAGASLASGLFLGTLGSHSTTLLLLGSCLYGTFGMSIFGLSAAHANDHADAGEFVAISGGLLLVYGIGSIMGPVLATVFMEVISPNWLFIYMAIVHSFLLIIGIFRLTRRSPVPAEEQEDYIAIAAAQKTPLFFELDPRSDADGEGD